MSAHGDKPKPRKGPSVQELSAAGSSAPVALGSALGSSAPVGLGSALGSSAPVALSSALGSSFPEHENSSAPPDLSAHDVDENIRSKIIFSLFFVQYPFGLCCGSGSALIHINFGSLIRMQGMGESDYTFFEPEVCGTVLLHGLMNILHPRGG